MSSQLKSSFSIESLIQPTKTPSDHRSSDPVITSSTMTSRGSAGSQTSQDQPWSISYNPSYGMIQRVNNGYIQLPLLSLPGTVSPPPSPAPSSPVTDRHTVPRPSPTSSLSPNTSDSEGHSGSSSPESSHKKNGRMSYTASQVSRLESVFQTTPYPNCMQYENLAEELGLPVKKIKVWFQNKRARNKRRVQDIRLMSYPPVSMPPVTSGLQPTVTTYPYMMSGIMMTPPSIMMTPPSSPVEMQMMQSPFFTFPTSCSPIMHPVQAPSAISSSGAL